MDIESRISQIISALGFCVEDAKARKDDYDVGYIGAIKKETEKLRDDLRAVLAKAMPIPKQEPIYMWRLEDDGWMECTKEWFDADISSGYEKRIVYSDPQPAQAAAMPEITDEMRDAGGEALYGISRERAIEIAKEEKFDSYADQAVLAFEAMLSASPKP